jgi:hypothetical protein
VAVHDGSATVSKAMYGAVKRAEEDEMGGGTPRWCVPLIGARGDGRWRRQSHGHSRVVVAAVRRPSAWLGTAVRTGSSTGGSRVVSLFSKISKTG